MFKRSSTPRRTRERRGDGRPQTHVVQMVGEAGEIDLSTLVSILLRQWLLIGVVTGIVVAAGFGYASVAPKIWLSTARVLLDPRDKQITSGADVVQPVQGVDTVWVTTQVDLVTSAATLDAVIDKLQLEKDPQFGGSRADTERKLAESIKVERADQTYVLNISAFSRDPERSMKIAQALADAFVDSMVIAKAAAVHQASDLINRQLEELRAKARAAQEKLEAFKKQNGIVSANGKLVDEDTLRQLNDAYVAAGVRTRQAKARLDAALQAIKAGSLTDGLLDNLNSTVISRLKIERALAARTVSELAQDLGPNHPRMIAAKADLDRAQAQIDDELRALSTANSTDYEAAKAAEASARQAVDRASSIVSDMGQTNIQLTELENEAALRNDMYKNYVARTAEIGLQANTQISDARVIVPASTPLYPYSPRKTIILALSGIAGLGVALTLALFRGRKYLPTAAPRQEPVMDRKFPQNAAIAPVGSGAPDLTAAPEPVVKEPSPLTVAPSQPPIAAPSVDSEAEAALPEIEVLGELTVCTTSFDGAGLPVAAREILTSVVADGNGLPLADGVGECRRLLRRLAKMAAPARTIAVLGIGEDGPAIAAISYALATTRDQGDVLVIDASLDPLALVEAWDDQPLPGLVDAIAGRVPADDIAFFPADSQTTLVAVGQDAEAIARDAQSIADFIDSLRQDHDRTYIHFGSLRSTQLLDQMIGKVDAVLLVAARSVEDDAESIEMIAELAAALPVRAALVLFGERPAVTATHSQAA